MSKSPEITPFLYDFAHGKPLKEIKNRVIEYLVSVTPSESEIFEEEIDQIIKIFSPDINNNVFYRE